MKKTVTIRKTIELVVEVELDDKLVSDQYIEAFKENMWDIDDENGVFEHACYHIIEGNIGHDHDFIGVLGHKDYLYDGKPPDTSFKYKERYEDIEYEFS